MILILRDTITVSTWTTQRKAHFAKVYCLYSIKDTIIIYQDQNVWSLRRCRPHICAFIKGVAIFHHRGSHTKYSVNSATDSLSLSLNRFQGVLYMRMVQVRINLGCCAGNASPELWRQHGGTINWRHQPELKTIFFFVLNMYCIEILCSFICCH